MKNKIINLLLVFILSLTLVSCKKEVKVVSISVVESSIPAEILLNEVDDKLSNIKIEVIKSNDEKNEINLTKQMISSEDLNKLENVGMHSITIDYEGVTTTISLNIVNPVNNNYTVTVLYPDNTPVNGGVFVQWCEGEMCFMPEEVNANGVAEIELEDGDYYIHLESGIPAGYTYNPNIYTTSATNKHVEVKLIKLNDLSSGNGSSDNPYVVKTGCYNLTYDAKGTSALKYFSFTASTSGEYVISSLAIDKLAQNKIDPYLSFLGTTNDLANRDVSGNTAGNINFNYTFNATEGVTYYFTVHLSSADRFPASFDFEIFAK